MEDFKCSFKISSAPGDLFSFNEFIAFIISSSVICLFISSFKCVNESVSWLSSWAGLSSCSFIFLKYSYRSCKGADLFG